MTADSREHRIIPCLWRGARTLGGGLDQRRLNRFQRQKVRTNQEAKLQLNLRFFWGKAALRACQIIRPRRNPHTARKGRVNFRAPQFQWLQLGEHNSLISGSSRRFSGNLIEIVRTTKERLDHRLRTTRFSSLRTTRFCHLIENKRQFGSVSAFPEYLGLKIRAQFFTT